MSEEFKVADHTPQFVARLNLWISTCLSDRNANPTSCLNDAAERGIAFVDMDRQRYRIDIQVYESAQYRMRMLEARVKELETQLNDAEKWIKHD